MSNYKWVTFAHHGETDFAKQLSLRNADFTNFSFPYVRSNIIDELVKAELHKNGIKCELEIDYDAYYYVLSPINPELIEITAPLYLCHENPDYSIEYEKIADAYTAQTIAPSQFEWVKEELIHCKDAVSKKQAEKFSKLFQERSMDGGLTALIDVADYRCLMPDASFLRKYIPEDSFFEVCALTQRQFFSRETTQFIIFMKNMDAKGGIVTIRVPEQFKGLTIGKGGRNIKNIAKKINARRITVV